jgi:hypothetical protein
MLQKMYAVADNPTVALLITGVVEDTVLSHDGFGQEAGEYEAVKVLDKAGFKKNSFYFTMKDWSQPDAPPAAAEPAADGSDQSTDAAAAEAATTGSLLHRKSDAELAWGALRLLASICVGTNDNMPLKDSSVNNLKMLLQLYQQLMDRLQTYSLDELAAASKQEVKEGDWEHSCHLQRGPTSAAGGAVTWSLQLHGRVFMLPTGR